MGTPATRTEYCLFDTAIGECGVAWSVRGITRFQLPEAGKEATERRLRSRSGGARCGDPPAAIKALIADVQRYFAGAEVDFSSVVVDLAGIDEVHRAIYDALRAVGWGRTTTYGALASAVGFLDDAREVGQAMAKNRVPVIIPCHRVLAAGGKMGGFSAPGGTATKQKLLALEGVRLGDDAPRLPGL